ncbi:MAG: helix-turn-helix transcriptional regulator [Litorimonas sp.]
MGISRNDNYDEGQFIDDIRHRLRVLLRIRGKSMQSVSLEAGGSDASLKDFLSGRKKTMRLTTFLGWARALDTPYAVLIDNAGYGGVFDPHNEAAMVDESKLEEVELRRRSGRNLRFLREALGLSQSELAEAARVFKGEVAGVPDAELVEAWETGRKMIPPLSAMRLTESLGILADEIYGSSAG